MDWLLSSFAWRRPISTRLGHWVAFSKVTRSWCWELMLKTGKAWTRLDVKKLLKTRNLELPCFYPISMIDMFAKWVIKGNSWRHRLGNSETFVSVERGMGGYILRTCSATWEGVAALFAGACLEANLLWHGRLGRWVHWVYIVGYQDFSSKIL